MFLKRVLAYLYIIMFFLMFRINNRKVSTFKCITKSFCAKRASSFASGSYYASGVASVFRIL